MKRKSLYPKSCTKPSWFTEILVICKIRLGTNEQNFTIGKSARQLYGSLNAWSMRLYRYKYFQYILSWCDWQRIPMGVWMCPIYKSDPLNYNQLFYSIRDGIVPICRTYIIDWQDRFKFPTRSMADCLKFHAANKITVITVVFRLSTSRDSCISFPAFNLKKLCNFTCACFSARHAHSSLNKHRSGSS